MRYSKYCPPPEGLFLCRQTGQVTSEEVKTKDLRRELEDKERDVRAKRGRDKPRSFTG